MNSLFVHIPKWIEKIFNNQIWSIPTNNKEIYLTFDDGPTPEITEWVLSQLDQYDSKATFFCIGKNIEAHPELAKKLITKGHTIGNHTFNHLKGWKTNNALYIENIDKTDKLIQQYQFPNGQKFFRPPYGKIKPVQTKILTKKGYKIIMWDVLSADFDNNTSEENCFLNVVKNAEKGSIIVFHDSIKAKKNLQYALPKVLEYFSKKGYKFKALA